MAKYNLITQLLLQSGDYEKGLNKAKKETQQFAQSVEKLSNGAKYLAGLAAGFLAVGTASEVTKRFINATAASAGEFEKTMITAKVTTDEFFRLLNIGDFSNLLDGLKNAVELGKEYAEILDILGDRRRSLSMYEAKANNEISKLYEIYNDKKNEKDIRLDALNQIIEKEKKLGEYKLKIASEQYQADLSLMLNKTQWSKEEQQDLENLLLTFNDADKLREAAFKYNEYKENASYTGSGGYGSAEAVNIMRKKANDYLKTITAEQAQLLEKYYKNFLVYDEKSDENIDKWVNSFKNLYDVQTQVQEKTNSIIKKSSSLELGIGENEEKEVKEINKLLDEQTKIRYELYDIIENTANYNLNKKKKNDYIKIDNSDDDIFAGFEDTFKPAILQLSLYDTVVGSIVETNIKLNNSFINLSDAIAGTMAGFTSDLAQGAESFQEYSKNVKNSIRELIRALLAQTVAQVISSQMAKLASNPFTLALAPIIAAAGAGMVSTAFNSLIPKFENGGIVGGYSFTGDKVPALVNSGEMVLNQSQQARLFALANGGGNTGGTVEFEIRGDKLVGVLNNYNRKQNSFR